MFIKVALDGGMGVALGRNGGGGGSGNSFGGLLDESVQKKLNAALLRAVRDKCGHDIPKLVSNGANVNCRDGEGKTPLMIARELGFVDIAFRLERHGAKE